MLSWQAFAAPVPRAWQRSFAVLAVLGLSAVLACRPSLVYLAAIGGLVGVIALSRWPSVGICALIVAGLVIPFGILTATQTEVNPTVLLVALLAALWLLERVVVHDIRLPRSATKAPVFGFGGAAILMCVLSARFASGRWVA